MMGSIRPSPRRFSLEETLSAPLLGKDGKSYEEVTLGLKKLCSVEIGARISAARTAAQLDRQLKADLAKL